MAFHAYVLSDSNVQIQPNGDLLILADTWYWEENGTAVVFSSDVLPVAVTITPNMTAAQMNTAIVAAVKAVGLASLGWTMGSNTVIHRSMNRG